MGKTIVIASGKGGTGKTSSSAALGAALALRGKRTLVIDCDAGLRNLDLILGVSDLATMDFYDVLSHRCDLEEAAVEQPQVPGLFLLTAPSLHGPEEIEEDAFLQMVEAAKERFDYCLLDAPAGIGPGFLLALSAAEEAVVVCNADAASLRDGERVAWEIRRRRGISARLVVNRLQPKLLRLGSSTVDNIIDEVGLQLLGLVREDRDVILAGNRGIPLCQYRKKAKKRSALRQFERIAARLDGNMVPLGKL